MRLANKRSLDGMITAPDDLQSSIVPPLPGMEAGRAKHRKAAKILRALANEDRFRILCRLHNAKTTVTTLAEALDIPQPAVSQHLAKLREVDLVDFEQNHKRRLYRLNGLEAYQLINALRQSLRV